MWKSNYRIKIKSVWLLFLKRILTRLIKFSDFVTQTTLNKYYYEIHICNFLSFLINSANFHGENVLREDLKTRSYTEDKLKKASRYFSRDGSFKKAKWRLENHYMEWTDREKTNFGRVRGYVRSHDRLKRYKRLVLGCFACE